MPVEYVDVGTISDDGTGDPLRDAFQKLNNSIAYLNAGLGGGLPPVDLTGPVPSGYPVMGTVLYGITHSLPNPRVLNDTNWYFDIDGTNLVAGPVPAPPGTYDIIIEDGTDGEAVVRRMPVTVTIGAAATYVGVMPDIWLAGSDHGTGDGSSAANARSIFTAFQSSAITLNPGDRVGIIADLGPINLNGSTGTLAFDQAGTLGNEIVVTGVASDGRPMPVRIEGQRYPYPVPRDTEQVIFVVNDATAAPEGRTFMFFSTATHDVVFENIFFQNVLVGFNFFNAGTYNRYTFNKIYARNFQRVIECNTTCNMVGFRMNDWIALGYSKQTLRIRGGSNDIIVTNVYCDSQRQDDDIFAVGVQLDGTAHDVHFVDCHFLNSHQALYPENYANADGISSELGNYDITETRCVHAGSTDGGSDHKARDFISTDDTFTDNKRNIRVWGRATFIRPFVGIPHDRTGANQYAYIHVVGAFHTLPNKSDQLFVSPIIPDISYLPPPVLLVENNSGYAGTHVVRLVDADVIPDDRIAMTSNVTIWRAASLPVAAPAAVGSATVETVNARISLLTVDTDQDCIIVGVSGTDAALVTPVIPPGLNVNPKATFLFDASALSIGATASFTISVEGIGRMTADIPVTVNVIAFSATPYLAAMDVAPTGPHQTAIEAFADGLVTDNIAQYFDFLMIALHDEQSSYLNMFDPDYSATKVGSVVLTPNLRLTGDGGAAHIINNRGWIYTGSKFTQDTAFMGSWTAQQNAPTGGRPAFGVNLNGRNLLYYDDTSGAAVGRINDSTDIAFVHSIGSRAQHIAVGRIAGSGADCKRLYGAGALLGTSTTASAFPTGLPTSHRFSTSYSPDGLFAWYTGGGITSGATMDTLMTNLHSRLNTLKTALAIP